MKYVCLFDRKIWKNHFVNDKVRTTNYLYLYFWHAVLNHAIISRAKPNIFVLIEMKIKNKNLIEIKINSIIFT